MGKMLGHKVSWKVLKLAEKNTVYSVSSRVYEGVWVQEVKVIL